MKTFSEFLNENLSDHELTTIASEVATEIDDQGGWRRMSSADIVDEIRKYMKDNVHDFNDQDIKKVYNMLEIQYGGGEAGKKKHRLRKDIPADRKR